MSVSRATPLKNRFFPTSVITESQSMLFVKRVFAMSVSQILFVRKFLPTRAFSDRNWSGYKLKILDEKSPCAASLKIINWIRATFAALEKRYIKSVVLIVYPKENDVDCALEAYTFRFLYNNEQVSLTLSNQSGSNDESVYFASSSDTKSWKDGIAQMLESIQRIQDDLSELPEDAMLTMKLNFDQENTPDDFSIPGFVSGDSYNFRWDQQPENLRIGCVFTKYHGFKFLMQTRDSFTKSNSQAEVSEKQDIYSAESASEDEDVDDMFSEKSPTQKSDQQQIVKHVRCACCCEEEDGLMIQCGLCETWQHGVCYLIYDHNIPSSRICDTCVDENPAIIQDPACSFSFDGQLESMKKDKRKLTCLLRRAVYLCLDGKITSLTTQDLINVFNLPPNTCRGIINRLKKERVFLKGDLIDKVRLENVVAPEFLELEPEMKLAEKSQVSPIKSRKRNCEEGDESFITPKRRKCMFVHTPILSVRLITNS